MLQRPNKQLAAGLLRMWESIHDDPDLTEEWDMGPKSDLPDLAGKSEAETVELIVEWFYANLEDVAHTTPWVEGEYFYLWSGPYNTRNELEDLFGGIVPEEIIDAAVEEIGDDYRSVPSENRMRPELPKNELVAAKRKLAEVFIRLVADATNGEFVVNATGGEFAINTTSGEFATDATDGEFNADATTALFNIQAVPLVLREVHRLQQQIDSARRTLGCSEE